MFLKFLEQHRINTLELAAAFFSSYETMKKILPLSDRLAPVNHMISASVAEVVRMFPLHLSERNPIFTTPLW